VEEVGTFVEHIARWGVINDHDLREIRLYGSQVFNVRSASICTVLAVISLTEILAVLLQPVYHGICIFLHRCGKYN